MGTIIPTINTVKNYTIFVENIEPLSKLILETYSSKAKLWFAQPLNVDDIAVDNPELRIVTCHLGNP